ncbi:MAG TPA: ribose-phosphate pyrophosphokinase [candidate division WOR-3 bacterium]|uniref:Ribose-phosphate pyrophosphokinase n=1 Tax=candidate division WOR-3 bacterium TaxID=2052148 RepID=A0A7C0X8I1_UNCW3|nr:ribose-phosphate pyrophosphokinase [candidate division WOR-3 bacterium]
MSEIKLLSGIASRKLMEDIARYLEVVPAESIVSRFSDGEIRVQILENVRGDDVFIVQSTQPPADNLMELLLLIDAARRASASRVTAVIPYFGYARQDRKDQPRVPISSKLVANLIERAGADRVLTVDLHADQIQGFFDIPVDNLYATPIFKEYFGHLDPERYVIVSPDIGSIKRARHIANKLGNLPIALVDKRRPSPNRAEVINIVGDVSGKDLLIVDDIIDTGSTLCEAAKALKDKGANLIRAAATHGLFSGNAGEKIDQAPIDEVVITDTLTVEEGKKPGKLKILGIANLLGEAIRRIHEERSVSSLFI